MNLNNIKGYKLRFRDKVMSKVYLGSKTVKGASGYNWVYEGVLTVGALGGGRPSHYGYDNNIFNPYGSISPLLGFNRYIRYVIASNIIEANAPQFTPPFTHIEIDGQIYENATLTPNPFPAVGQTCNVKLGYAL